MWQKPRPAPRLCQHPFSRRSHWRPLHPLLRQRRRHPWKRNYLSPTRLLARPRAKKAPLPSSPQKREIGLEKQSAGQIAGVAGAVRSDAMPLPKVRVQSQASTSATLPSAPATRATAAVPATPRLLANKTTEPPDGWMKRILEFKALRKMREFEGELAKFRKQYPDYLLPEELKGHK